MVSHFSSIGFDVTSEEELISLAERVAGWAQIIEVKPGRYLRWAPGTGEQLWLQLDRQGRLVGVHPHFAGKSSVRVRLEGKVFREADTPLDGAFRGWANPQGDTPDTGDYPFVFDCPDARVYGDLALPAMATVQIAAFAHKVSVYESREAYDASQASETLKFASRSFIPAGLFSSGGGATEPPEAHAIFTGHVLETAKQRNSLTGLTFRWALVDTLGGTFDVVIDPSLLSDAPRPGGVLSGSFWLSGRLLSYAKRRPGWSGKLVGGTGQRRAGAASAARDAGCARGSAGALAIHSGRRASPGAREGGSLLSTGLLGR